MTADTETTAASTLDLLAADFRVNSEAVREAAERHWYAETTLGPAVLRYEDCAAILRDRRFRQGGADHLADQGITDGPLAEMWRDVILNIHEGDRHNRLRRLVSQAFTPNAVDELRPRMRRIVHDLVDTFAPAGACEFMGAFADHYPPQVMFDLLGIPEEDHPQFLEWGKTLGLTLSYSVAEHVDAIEAALSGLYAATDRLCASRRRRPGDDLISRLVAAADQGDRLTDQELRSMVAAFVIGGQDTTRNQLGLAMVLFARHPDQWALLACRPELAAQATEEVIRVAPAVPIVWRAAAEDVVWRDLSIPAGTRLWILVGAAHTDEATFGPDARRFDISVADRPSQLAFGHGVHYCLGAALARAEIAEALPILASRLPGLELTNSPEFRPDISGFTGPNSLPIRFETSPGS
ncbi:MAG: cytochrome P450 [Acidimicrobiia bacterium]